MKRKGRKDEAKQRAALKHGVGEIPLSFLSVAQPHQELASSQHPGELCSPTKSLQGSQAPN